MRAYLPENCEFSLGDRRHRQDLQGPAAAGKRNRCQSNKDRLLCMCVRRRWWWWWPPPCETNEMAQYGAIWREIPVSPEAKKNLAGFPVAVKMAAGGGRALHDQGGRYCARTGSGSARVHWASAAHLRDIRFGFEGAGAGFTSVLAPMSQIWFGLNFGAHEPDSVRFQRP
jgi:hypothetical protein